MIPAPPRFELDPDELPPHVREWCAPGHVSRIPPPPGRDLAADIAAMFYPGGVRPAEASRIPAPPPSVDQMPRGTILRAGLGVAVVLPDMDFETYSEAGYCWNETAAKWVSFPGAPSGKNSKGLGAVGAAVYAEHPSTEVLSFAYDLKDGAGKRLWIPGMPNPADLFVYLASGGHVEAHNVGFEFWIWNRVCTRRYGWPPLLAESCRCSAGKARAYALPGALGKLGPVLQIEQLKDADGDRLLKKFSVPRNPTAKDKRRRLTLADDPIDGDKLIAYNLQDIVTEAHVSARVPDLQGEELQFWLLDQRINRRGVQMDVAGIHACCAIVDQALDKYNRELYVLTGGAVARASELAKLKTWLGAQGVLLGEMDEDAIDEVLAKDDKRRGEPDWVDLGEPHFMGGRLPAGARRALELRQRVGSAAVKKVYSMRLQITSAGRLHDLFTYYGARTGRTTGNGPQPTNLPNSGPEVYLCGCGKHFGTHTAVCPWCRFPGPPNRKPVEWGPAAVEDALQVIASRDLATVEYFFGDAFSVVSGSLRGLFCAPEGYDHICSDYSAIEAVVLAMIAGEQWRIDVFRTHGKIYEMSAAKITGTVFEDFMKHAGYSDAELAAPDWYTRKPAAKGSHHPLRKTIGKVAELASGYQGWIGSWKAFGADAFMSDDEMKKAILAWREASPAIVEFWGGQSRGWNKPAEMYGVEGMFISAIIQPGTVFEFRGFKFFYQNDVLYLTLLSGRNLHYHRPRLRPSEKRAGDYAISYEGNNTNPKNGPVGWIRMDTWGGRLTENIVQATARDIQWFGMLNLERAGYPIVLHVYDEDVAEVPVGFGSVKEFESIMATMPAWAHDWPIKAAGGWRGRRYRKD